VTPTKLMEIFFSKLLILMSIYYLHSWPNMSSLRELEVQDLVWADPKDTQKLLLVDTITFGALVFFLIYLTFL